LLIEQVFEIWLRRECPKAIIEWCVYHKRLISAWLTDIVVGAAFGSRSMVAR
jgi:hypothetical protein